MNEEESADGSTPDPLGGRSEARGSPGIVAVGWKCCLHIDSIDLICLATQGYPGYLSRVNSQRRLKVHQPLLAMHRLIRMSDESI